MVKPIQLNDNQLTSMLRIQSLMGRYGLRLEKAANTKLNAGRPASVVLLELLNTPEGKEIVTNFAKVDEEVPRTT
jgi:hypothetical protein